MAGGRLEGKNALVTGGASGIGRATAVRFAEEGANVLIADLAEAEGETACEELRALGRKASFQKTDISDADSIKAAVDRTVAELGGIDILFAAAGVSHADYRLGEPRGSNKLIPVVDLPFEKWRKTLAINLDGMFLLTQAVAREMIKAGKGGRIITVASAAVRQPQAGMAGYNASKAGVWVLTNTLAKELAEYDITCNTIGPGLTLTPMLGDYLDLIKSGTVPRAGLLKRWGEPVDVANTAVFLAAEDGRNYTGHVFFPDGGAVMH